MNTVKSPSKKSLKTYKKMSAKNNADKITNLVKILKIKDNIRDFLEFSD